MPHFWFLTFFIYLTIVTCFLGLKATHVGSSATTSPRALSPRLTLGPRSLLWQEVAVAIVDKVANLSAPLASRARLRRLRGVLGAS